MSAPNDDAWFVLLTEGPPHAPLEAADVVGRAKTRLTRFDALRAFRTDCGLLPSPVPRIEAERIASALSASGVGALAIPGARLHLPAPARTLAWAVPTDEGLRVRLGWQDDASTLPWTFFHAWRVARVLATGGTRDLARLQNRAAAARIPAPVSAPAPLVTREDLKAVGLSVASSALSWLVDVPFAEAWAVARGLSHARNGDPEDTSPPDSAAQRAPEPELWLDLCGLEPPLRLRIRQATFDYAVLGAARGPSSRVNFSALVRLLSPHLTHAEPSGHIEDARAGRLANNRDGEDAQPERDHDLALLGLLTRLSLRVRP